MLPQIALRNLTRNTRRTGLSLVIIGIGTTALLLTAGFVRASFEGLRDAIIGGGLGHFEVAPTRAEGETSSPISGLPPAIGDWQHLRSSIESSSYVDAVGAVIQFAGMATNGERSGAFVGIGVEPDKERRMGMAARIRSGADLPLEHSSEQDAVAILGTGLARNLAAHPGDTITVMIATSDGGLNALDLRVTGIFTTGVQDLDDRLLKTTIPTAQRLLSTDRVSSLVVHLRDIHLMSSASADLSRRLSASPTPLAAVSWDLRAPFYKQVRSLYIGIFAFLGTIVAALVALSNSNTLMMSVLERVREFGTLLAMGTTRSQLARLILWEALWLGAIGSALGGTLGLILASLINASHIKMPPPPGAVDPIDLAVTLVPSDAALAVVFMVTVVLLAAAPPMLRLLRLKVIEALAHV